MGTRKIMRYDKHEAIDSILSRKVMRIKLNPFAKRQKTGQNLVIETHELQSDFCPGISSNYLAARKEVGFLKSIRENLPESPSIMNQSTFETEWTKNVAEAIQFSEAESIRWLNNYGIGCNALPLRLPYTSSCPQGWLNSLDQFPCQKAVDRWASVRVVQ